MDGVDGGSGAGGASGGGDPLATVGNEGGGSGGGAGNQVGGAGAGGASTVYVTIPQGAVVSTAKGVQSVIQQPQPSVIQSTALQTVQISKGNVILLKQPTNSVIQTAAGGHTLQAVQVLEGEADDSDPTRKRQILARRPSYRKILNDLGGGEISVVPASALQLTGQGEGLQTIAMTNTANAGGAIVHYAQGSDGQFIVPGSPGTVFATSDLSGLKIATTSSSNFPQGVVLATSASSVHGSSADQLAEEASRKREIRLMKNREAAKECRAKKKEYIKCLENRVAVLENQNKALIEELKTLKALYCQNS